MTKGEKFVAHYPLMFKEDKWWWAQELDKHFAEKFKCISCDAEVEQEDMACETCCVRGTNTGHNFKLD